VDDTFNILKDSAYARLFGTIEFKRKKNLKFTLKMKITMPCHLCHKFESDFKSISVSFFPLFEVRLSRILSNLPLSR
jgi:hypothetical protein